MGTDHFAERTGLGPATSSVTGKRSNQTELPFQNLIEYYQIMTNIEIARLLRKIAAAYTILGENRFKIIAYENAATAIEHATSELHDLWKENELKSIPGLGASITSHLDEIFKTGESKHFEEVLKKINPKVFPLLEVPGIGPKKALQIVKTGKIPKYLLPGLERYKKRAIKENRMVLPVADALANEVIAYLGVKVDKLGSLRRQVATIGDIDLAVATNNPKEIINKFVSYPGELIEKGPTGASILLSSGRQIDLRVAKPEEYGAMLQYFTGSKYHNIKLRELVVKKHLTLNEYGIGKKRFKTENQLYNFLGMDYIPPELREDTGEIEAALKHNLPKLVELRDIMGDLHMHTNFNLETSHDSGANSIEEMRDEANKLNYEFIAMTNHNPSSKTDSLAKIKAQKAKIEHINESNKSVRILNLLEVDIHPDGTLPVSEDGLKFLDACLVSIHSSFGMDKATMTKRIIAGLSHPAAKILAHPTGRLLGTREGYEVDWLQIFDFCLKNNKALEINCYPNRLDLPDTLVREAVKKGVLLSLGTDAHAKDAMSLMPYGVAVARRGWCEGENIINTWSYSKIDKWLKLRSV